MAVLITRRRFFLWLPLLVAAEGLRADLPHSIDDLRAVFLFNFGSYVEWPGALSDEAPFRIGICGDPDLASAVEKVVSGERIQGHAVRVLRVRRADEARSCQVLHLAAGTETAAGLEALAGRPVLTCGETERFEAEGGMIRFVVERNRIRLRVDLAAVSRSGLRVSSQLLRICETRGTR